jgi:predicted DNA-binding transcriptional regulator YafY
LLLQARGALSARVLALELEVTVRTILRDVDQLSAAGVPIYGERGRGGGFRLLDGWSTQLTGMNQDEAQALLLAGMPDAATQLGLGQAAASARLKLIAALPFALRADAARVSERLHIDPVAWYRREDAPAFLQAVATAVWQQRRLKVKYESWEGTVERVLCPLGLVLKAGVWYLVGQLNAKHSPRSYRLAAIIELETLSASFKFPAGFDLPSFWQKSSARFESEINTAEASLRVSARGLKWLKELNSASARMIKQSCRQLAKNRFLVSVPIESIDHAARQMLGMSAELEVLEPKALRRALLRLARLVVARYQGRKT